VRFDFIRLSSGAPVLFYVHNIILKCFRLALAVEHLNVIRLQFSSLFYFLPIQILFVTRVSRDFYH